MAAAHSEHIIPAEWHDLTPESADLYPDCFTTSCRWVQSSSQLNHLIECSGQLNGERKQILFHTRDCSSPSKSRGVSPFLSDMLKQVRKLSIIVRNTWFKHKGITYMDGNSCEAFTVFYLIITHEVKEQVKISLKEITKLVRASPPNSYIRKVHVKHI